MIVNNKPATEENIMSNFKSFEEAARAIAEVLLEEGVEPDFKRNFCCEVPGCNFPGAPAHHKFLDGPSQGRYKLWVLTATRQVVCQNHSYEELKAAKNAAKKKILAQNPGMNEAEAWTASAAMVGIVSVPLVNVWNAMKGEDNNPIEQAVKAKLQEGTICAISGVDMTYADGVVMSKFVLNFYRGLTDDEIDTRARGVDAEKARLAKLRALVQRFMGQKTLVSTDPAETAPMVHRVTAEQLAAHLGYKKGDFFVAPARGDDGEVFREDAPVFYTAASYFRNRFHNQEKWERKQAEWGNKAAQRSADLDGFAAQYGVDLSVEPADIKAPPTLSAPIGQQLAHKGGGKPYKGNRRRKDRWQ